MGRSWDERWGGLIVEGSGQIGDRGGAGLLEADLKLERGYGAGQGGVS